MTRVYNQRKRDYSLEKRSAGPSYAGRSICFRVTSTMRDTINAKALEFDMTATALIQRAVDEYLAKRERPVVEAIIAQQDVEAVARNAEIAELRKEVKELEEALEKMGWTA